MFCQRGRKNPHGCVIQSPLYWLILWACGILLLILYLFWLLFSKYRQLVKSLRVPFKTGGIRPNEASTLWGMHTRICLRSTICICYCCHIYFVSFIKIYRLLLRPFVFWANICSVIPRHFLSASNQKSCERPSLEINFLSSILLVLVDKKCRKGLSVVSGLVIWISRLESVLPKYKPSISQVLGTSRGYSVPKTFKFTSLIWIWPFQQLQYLYNPPGTSSLVFFTCAKLVGPYWIPISLLVIFF